MTARARSADPRAARTRGAMKVAALDLVSRRRIETVTARDITDAAGVSRAAFYQHFADRDDVVAAGIDDLMRAAATGGSSDADVLRGFADFAHDHAALYRNVYPSVAAQRAAATFRRLARNACERIVRERSPAAGRDAVEVATTLFVGGMFEVIRAAVDEGIDPRDRVEVALHAIGVAEDRRGGESHTDQDDVGTVGAEGTDAA